MKHVPLTTGPAAARPPFLVGMAPGRCRFVLFYLPRRITSAGLTHQAAVACGEPVAPQGGSWCAHHRAALFEPARTPPAAPEDRTIIARALRASRTPDLCEELS